MVACFGEYEPSGECIITDPTLASTAPQAMFGFNFLLSSTLVNTDVTDDQICQTGTMEYTYRQDGGDSNTCPASTITKPCEDCRDQEYGWVETMAQACSTLNTPIYKQYQCQEKDGSISSDPENDCGDKPVELQDACDCSNEQIANANLEQCSAACLDNPPAEKECKYGNAGDLVNRSFECSPKQSNSAHGSVTCYLTDQAHWVKISDNTSCAYGENAWNVSCKKKDVVVDDDKCSGTKPFLACRCKENANSPNQGYCSASCGSEP